MGGNAFAKPGPNGEPSVDTPRMIPEVYQRLKKSALVCVSEHYKRVVSLHDAPGKDTFGDIDIYVASPQSEDAIHQIATSLNAKRIVWNGPGVHLAIPTLDDKDGNDCTFAQLDLHNCEASNMDWMVFMHSYGDVGQILGVCNYDSGFTSNPKGFHVRIEEQEAIGFKASFIHLSNDPNQVMKFLGLDAQAYEQGFTTLNGLFEWLSHCRTISLEAFEDAPLDSKERHRRETRLMYSKFFEEWMPSAASGRESVEEQDRSTLLHDALKFFGKEAEYEERMVVVREMLAGVRVWPLVIKFLVEDTTMSEKETKEVVRSLQRWTYFAEGQPHIRIVVEMDKTNQTGFGAWLSPPERTALKEGSAKSWILKHYAEVKILERKRMKEARMARAVIKLADDKA